MLFLLILCIKLGFIRTCVTEIFLGKYFVKNSKKTRKIRLLMLMLFNFCLSIFFIINVFVLFCIVFFFLFSYLVSQRGSIITLFLLVKTITSFTQGLSDSRNHLLIEVFIAHTVREIYEIYETEYKLDIDIGQFQLSKVVSRSYQLTYSANVKFSNDDPFSKK